jgi:hypothetical protein
MMVAALGRERAEVLKRIEHQRERVVDEMVAAIVEEIPLYQRHPDASMMADLRDHVDANVGLFLRTATDDRAPRADELVFIREAVEARIAQGFPIDQVLHAFRIGQQVMWEKVMSEARSHGAGAEAALSLALPAMRYTDAASSEFTERYVRVEQELRASSDRAGAVIVAALSEGRWPPERALAALQKPFPVRKGQRYLVAAVLGTSEVPMEQVRRHALLLGDLAPFEGAVAELTARELVLVVAVREDGIEKSHSALAARLRSICEEVVPAARIGVGGIGDGIGEIPSSRHEAFTAGRLAAPGTALALAALSLIERAAVMTSALGSPHRLVPDAVRRFVLDDLDGEGALVTTATTYVECDLNTRRTADALFLHPNTVRYRLGRLGELAGVDVRSPRQMVELVAGMRIVKLTRGTATSAS